MASVTHPSGLLVIATGITSLDEARYFSAMGASWLGFNGMKITPDEIRTMAEWVVGPQIFIEIERSDEELVRVISEIPAIKGICVSQGTDLPDWYVGDVIKRNWPGTSDLSSMGADLIIASSGSFDAGMSTGSQYCIVITDPREVGDIKASDIAGIVIPCLPGSDQEDAFEMYDRIFEAIENI